MTETGYFRVIIDKKDEQIEQQQGTITALQKENAELHSKIGMYQVGMATEINKRDILITKAKEIIRNLLRVTYGEGWTYSLDWKVKAEDFIEGVENDR